MGGDSIWGGAEGDLIDVGNGAEDTDVDTIYYFDQTESFGGSVDQVSNFTDGVVNGDIVDLSFVPFTFAQSGDPLEPAYLGQQFVGNGATFGQAQGLVTELDGIIDVVFQVDDQILWVDVNDDGTLKNNDLQSDLICILNRDFGISQQTAGSVTIHLDRRNFVTLLSHCEFF